MHPREWVSQLLLSNETKIFGNVPREADGLRDKNTVLCAFFGTRLLQQAKTSYNKYRLSEQGYFALRQSALFLYEKAARSFLAALQL